MRGRKPKPTALKLVGGNAGHRPLPANEPVPLPASLRAPSWLDVEARKHWKQIAPELSKAGVLSRLDTVALGAYCETFVRWREALGVVANEGAVVTNPSGRTAVSPYVLIADKALDQMLKLATEFGMTPSSRTRVQTLDEDSGNPFARFAEAHRSEISEPSCEP